MKSIAIFASGSGSNAESIIQYGKLSSAYATKLVMSNKSKAYVLERARKHNVDRLVVNREQFYEDREHVLSALEGIDAIVLAGFLWLIPNYIIAAFPNRILNIHPSLLPKFGGKGMYGQHVHKAVHLAEEKYSGMTVHMVNREYDKGKVLFQASRYIGDQEDPQGIGKAVLELEHKYYPKVIGQFVNSL